MVSTEWNIPSSDTIDGGAVVEYTETANYILKTQRPNESGNLTVQ